MRTIKFRGKQAFGGADWKYGNLCGTTNNVTIEEIIKDKEREKTYWTPHTQVIPETVGQFTGLLDKNGKEIYEGDIVQCCTFRYEVIYERNRFASFALNRKGDSFLHFLGEAMESAECEVIGNIHDNPELISEG